MPSRFLALLFVVVGSISVGKAQSVVQLAEVGTLTQAGAQGALAAGDFQLEDGTYLESWRLDVVDPGFLTVELASTDFDTYLFLALPDDTILQVNDDCDLNNFDLSCVRDVPTVVGTYYIGVNTFGAGEVGDYDLSMSITPLVVPEPSVLVMVVVAGMGLLRRKR